jgi:pSer/pThr/pTyr-binding forkhead associated (FHA) protein
MKNDDDEEVDDNMVVYTQEDETQMLDFANEENKNNKNNTERTEFPKNNIWGMLRRKGGNQEEIELQYRLKDNRKDTYKIGRGSENDIIILDKRVSSLHCLVYCDYDEFRMKIFLEDASANGTFINHSLNRLCKGARWELKSGDEIFLINPRNYDENAKIAAFTFVNMRERFIDTREIIVKPVVKTNINNLNNTNNSNTSSTTLTTTKNSTSLIQRKHIEDYYIIGDQLGVGMCGQVFYCIHKETRAPFAVKVIDTRKFALTPGLSIDDLKEEAELMKQLKHVC